MNKRNILLPWKGHSENIGLSIKLHMPGAHDMPRSPFPFLAYWTAVQPRYVVLPVTPPCPYSGLIVDSFFSVNIYHIWSQTNICPETPRNDRRLTADSQYPPFPLGSRTEERRLKVEPREYDLVQFKDVCASNLYYGEIMKYLFQKWKIPIGGHGRSFRDNACWKLVWFWRADWRAQIYMVPGLWNHRTDKRKAKKSGIR